VTKDERYQSIWHRFDGDQNHRPIGTREAVDWAITQGLLEEPKPTDPRDILASEMAHALRAEIQTDAKGRRYRVNHAVRISERGVQYTFWADMHYAPHQHMERAFAQRREQVVGDLVQLKTDVDVYNDLTKGKNNPIQLELDMTPDVEEKIEAQKIPVKRTSVA
jgi:hypothetical protein